MEAIQHPAIIEKTIDLLREGRLTPALRLVRLARPDAGVLPTGRSLVARIDRQTATRMELLRALFDRATPVRAVARKLVPLLSPDAADDLALLLLESLQPFRPAPPRSESGRFACPLAEPLMGLLKSGTRPSDPAGRLYRRAVSEAVEALALLSGRRYLQLREIVEAKMRSPLDQEPVTPLGWTLGLDTLGIMSGALGRSAESALLIRRASVADTLELWISGRTLVSTDSSALPFQQWCWLFVDGQDRRVQRRRLRSMGLHMAIVLPEAQRERACRLADLVLSQMEPDDPDRASLNGALNRMRSFRRTTPGIA